MSFDEEDKKSRFNAGVALTERIDALQWAINSARFNPMNTNFETGTLNYEVMISANEGLFYEAWAKLNVYERKLGKKIKELIYEYLKIYPPVSIDDKGNKIINITNSEKIIKLLNFFEEMNKDFLDKHDLNAPSKDEDEEDYDY